MRGTHTRTPHITNMRVSVERQKTEIKCIQQQAIATYIKCECALKGNIVHVVQPKYRR